VGLVLLVTALAALVGLALGGRPGGFARIRVGGLWLLVGAAVVQVAAAVWAPAEQLWFLLALLVTAVLAGWFVGRNLAVPGVGLMGLGLLLNGVVIALNGGMPVSAAAADRAGADWLQAVGDGVHLPAGAGTRLAWLGDVVPVADPLHREVVSVGDVLVAAGVALLVVTGLLEGRRLRPGVAASVPDARHGQEQTIDLRNLLGDPGQRPLVRRLEPDEAAAQASRAERSTIRDSDSTTRGSYS
jgi:hypothetical protein